MKKYREIGFGNLWIIRTEFENEDGTEREEKGFAKPFKLKSIYIRVWIGKKVMIIDSFEGFKLMTKRSKKFKFVLGFYGE